MKQWKKPEVVVVNYTDLTAHIKKGNRSGTWCRVWFHR